MGRSKPLADSIVVKASDSREFLTLCFDGKEVEIGATEVDDLIQELAQRRSLLVPQVQLEPNKNDPSKGFVNPIFAVSESDISGYTSFRLRDPGRGWLGYLFDKHQRALLLLHLASRETNQPN